MAGNHWIQGQCEMQGIKTSFIKHDVYNAVHKDAPSGFDYDPTWNPPVSINIDITADILAATIVTARTENHWIGAAYHAPLNTLLVCDCENNGRYTTEKRKLQQIFQYAIGGQIESTQMVKFPKKMAQNQCGPSLIVWLSTMLPQLPLICQQCRNNVAEVIKTLEKVPIPQSKQAMRQLLRDWWYDDQPEDDRIIVSDIAGLYFFCQKTLWQFV